MPSGSPLNLDRRGQWIKYVFSLFTFPSLFFVLAMFLSLYAYFPLCTNGNNCNGRWCGLYGFYIHFPPPNTSLNLHTRSATWYNRQSDTGSFPFAWNGSFLLLIRSMDCLGTKLGEVQNFQKFNLLGNLGTSGVLNIYKCMEIIWINFVIMACLWLCH